MNEIILLGSGDTLGSPVFGSHAQGNATDQRTRFGMLIKHGGKKLLIDTNPDLKWQCIETYFALSEVDHILVTHTHSDHLNGMGEFWQRRETPTIVHHPSDPISRKNIAYFQYLEREKVLSFSPYETHSRFELWPGCVVLPIELNHGFPCWGFVIEIDGKKLGIVSDSNDKLPKQSIDALEKCDLLFVDAFSENYEQVQELYKELGEAVPKKEKLQKEWFHMTISEARELQKKTGAKMTCTVHMSRFMAPQQELVEKYQSGDFLIGYDGLKLQF